MRKGKRILQIGALMLAVVLIWVGIAGGDYRTTRGKASVTCFECIGIG